MWSSPGWFPVVLVVVVIAVLGIPHGAVDHLVTEAIGDHDSETWRWRFVRRYVLAMVGVGLVWLAAPPLALAGFLVLSVHHFGQSDLAYLRLSGRRQLVAQWSRGLFLVGSPIVAHLTAVAPVIDRLGGGDPSGWPWLADVWWLWWALLVVQHVVVGAAVARKVDDRRVVAREAVTVAALAALFLAADPLVSFAVYFGLWHSLAHLLVLAGVLGTESAPVRSVVRLAAPLSAVALAGLAVFAGGSMGAGRPDLLVPGALVFVSMLTLPHMFVVERLWRRERERYGPGPARSAMSAGVELPADVDDGVAKGRHDRVDVGFVDDERR
jgi:beta-carotene 15,15'-dioxygenase